MNTYNPIDLLFGGMEKLAPGGNVHTLHVLRLLPKQQFHVIVDAGCGVGRQTMVLAKELGTLVHAVDSYEPFLNDLTRRTKEARIEPLVQTHCMDMKNIPGVFQHIDLLWSEGAAYNIGFSNALSTWASAINPHGFAVISELSWLREQIPDTVREFFISSYPDMQSIQQNLAVAENAGYKVLTTYTLPKEAWGEGYYATSFSRVRKPLSITQTPPSGILLLRPSKRSIALNALKRATATSSMYSNVPNQRFLRNLPRTGGYGAGAG